MSTFTVIIASRLGEMSPPSLKTAEHFALPGTEFIITCGNHPAVQRNRAAAQAKGDILVFLDDDAHIQANHFLLLTEIFKNDQIASAGGPSLSSPNDSSMAKAIQNAMASRWLTGPSANRYRSQGQQRFTNQSELILCNQAFRKAIYLQAGGLDERLYPNEENELMDRLVRENFKLMYDPNLAVLRPQRDTLGQFLKTLFRYGRGRSQQTRLTRLSGWATNYLPLGFSLICLGFLSFAFFLLNISLPQACLTAAFSLFIFLLPGILAAAEDKKNSLIYLVPLGHLAYATGLLFGLVTPFSKNQNVTVTLYQSAL